MKKRKPQIKLRAYLTMPSFKALSIPISLCLYLNACSEKPNLPKEALVSHQEAVPDKQSGGHLTRGSFSFNQLKGRYQLRVFNNAEEAEKFFRQDIPQRPLDRGAMGNLHWVRSRYALWLKQNLKVAYYVLFLNQGDWSNLSEEEYQKKQKSVTLFIERTLAKWQVNT